MPGLNREQKLSDNVGGGVGLRAGRKELSKMGEVIPGGDQGEFANTIGTHLGEAHCCREAVADTLAPHGFPDRSTFAEIMLQRFSRTSVANGSIVFAIEVSQIAEIAYTPSVQVISGVGKGLLQLGHFEWEACGGGQRIGKDAGLAKAAQREGLPFDFRVDS